MTIETFKEKAQTMRPMLLATAVRIVGEKTEAEDIVQDALLRLWQLRDEPIQNVEGMARVVVQHLSYDAVRRRHDCISIEKAEDMMVVMARMEEMVEMEEMAELIGVTEVWVRQSLSRARRRLMEQYGRIKS